MADLCSAPPPPGGLTLDHAIPPPCDPVSLNLHPIDTESPRACMGSRRSSLPWSPRSVCMPLRPEDSGRAAALGDATQLHERAGCVPDRLQYQGVSTVLRSLR
ncbi:unnamed protein product [Diplocarpon coronariae]|nr:hypothetical protein JHW43_008495 [Diplocarpon mali]